MYSTKYVVQLTPDARERLESVTRNGSAPAKKILHARVLLMSDQHHSAGRYRDHEIAAALGIHLNTVARIRKLFVQRGEEPALARGKCVRRLRCRPSSTATPRRRCATCCSPPPEGRVRWTLDLLRQEAVGRKIVTSICRETIRKTLKKHASTVAQPDTASHLRLGTLRCPDGAGARSLRKAAGRR